MQLGYFQVSGWIGRVDGSPAAVGKMPGVDFGALVPGKMGGQLYPAVARIKFHLVKIAEFLNFELVLGGVSYHVKVFVQKCKIICIQIHLNQV